MSVIVAALVSNILGTVTVAVKAAETTAGDWNVRSGRPGIHEGTVSTTFALEGAVAVAGTVNVAVTVAGTSAARVSGAPTL